MRRRPLTYRTADASKLQGSRLMRRLRDTRGAFLAEHLMSVIFIGLLCVAISAGIGAALSSYRGVTQATDANMLLSRSIEAVKYELDYSLSPPAPFGSYAAYVSPTTHTNVQLSSDDRGIILKGEGIGQDGADSLVLVPSTNGLSHKIVFMQSGGTFVFQIEIYQQGTLVESQNIVVNRVMG